MLRWLLDYHLLRLLRNEHLSYIYLRLDIDHLHLGVNIGATTLLDDSQLHDLWLHHLSAHAREALIGRHPNVAGLQL